MTLYDRPVSYVRYAQSILGEYQARWYNPVAGGQYRFVIAPRDGQEQLISPVFTFAADAENMTEMAVSIVE